MRARMNELVAASDWRGVVALEQDLVAMAARSRSSQLKNAKAVYNALGTAFATQGDYGKAIEYPEKGLEIAVAIGDRAGEGKAYANLGNVFCSQGEYGKAIVYPEKALENAVEIGDRAREGAEHGDLVNLSHA